VKICIIGKYPPIQGGASMRTYWTAHGLARLGHSVHVVTNAKETRAPHRMFMRPEDWERCEAQYGPGSVRVHWTESYGRREWHIPPGMPFVTKLASIGLELAREHGIDVVYSYYTEPYGIAGHIVAKAIGIPHVTRTAGSDAGRLWSLPQFAPLYREIYRSADAVITNPSVTQEMTRAGVSSARLAQDPEGVRIEPIFAPEGPVLDIEALRRDVLASGDPELRNLLFGEFDPSLTYFGIYGKLGEVKGTYALLKAIRQLKDEGVPIGLLALAHEFPASVAFREAVYGYWLQDHVCQLPFLPHWRVPEFIRRCVAICCLEQGFPIKFHTPVMAREALTCGGCLVGSTEVIHKLAAAHKLIDGYNCVAVADVNDTQQLKRQLRSVIEQPDRVRAMKRRARQYGAALERDNQFPRRVENILSNAARAAKAGSRNARPMPAPAALPQAPDAPGARQPFGRLDAAFDELGFKAAMAAVEAIQSTASTDAAQRLVNALKMDLLGAEKHARRASGNAGSGRETARVFRLQCTSGFFDDAALDDMVPRACEQYSFVELPPDVSRDDPIVVKSFAQKQSIRLGDAAPKRLWAIVPQDHNHTIRIVDEIDAALVRSCDGSRSVGELCDGGAESRTRILSLFQAGLIALQEHGAQPLKRV
jgi:glycosyltransferase involved in cell wall biosynthesis